MAQIRGTRLKGEKQVQRKKTLTQRNNQFLVHLDKKLLRQAKALYLQHLKMAMKGEVLTRRIRNHPSHGSPPNLKQKMRRKWCSVGSGGELVSIS